MSLWAPARALEAEGVPTTGGRRHRVEIRGAAAAERLRTDMARLDELRRAQRP